jgi:predicted nucleic acid-binding protein
MTNSWVCVDANLVIKIVVKENFSPEIRVLWRNWLNEERKIAAPPLLRYEVASVLRKQVVRGIRTADENRQALKEAMALDIQYIEPPDFHQRAFDMAAHLGRPAAYDTHYLALAEYLDCDFWTADERLVNAVKIKLPW